MDALLLPDGVANTTTAPEQIMEDARYIPLVVLNTISSCLSILGSSCIIYLSSKHPPSVGGGGAGPARKNKKILQRLLFSLSLADLISSTACLVMPLAAPSYLGYTLAMGTHKTCATAGFFMLAADMAGCCYNAYISVHFLLVVQWNWKDSDFTTSWWLGPVANGFALLVPLSINIVAVVTQSINPSRVLNNLCVYDVSPWGCAAGEDGDADCTRSNVTTESWLLGSTTLFYIVIASTGFVSTLWVWMAVRTKVQRSNAYRFERTIRSSSTTTKEHNSNRRGSTTTDLENSTRSARDGMDRTVSTNSVTTNPQRRNTINFLQEVRTQSMLYSLVYFNAFIWPVVAIILAAVNDETEHGSMHLEPGVYTFDVLSRFLFPFQGFLNFLVYTRMTRRQWRRAEPDKSIFWIYWKVLSSEPIPTPPPAAQIQTNNPAAMDGCSDLPSSATPEAS